MLKVFDSYKKHVVKVQLSNGFLIQILVGIYVQVWVDMSYLTLLLEFEKICNEGTESVLLKITGHVCIISTQSKQEFNRIVKNSKRMWYIQYVNDERT